MAKTILFPMLLDLQLFAEGAGGGDGGTGASGATGVIATAAVSQTGETATPAAEVVSPEDRNAKFEELIKGAAAIMESAVAYSLLISPVSRIDMSQSRIAV